MSLLFAKRFNTKQIFDFYLIGYTWDKPRKYNSACYLFGIGRIPFTNGRFHRATCSDNLEAKY